MSCRDTERTTESRKQSKPLLRQCRRWSKLHTSGATGIASSSVDHQNEQAGKVSLIIATELWVAGGRDALQCGQKQAQSSNGEASVRFLARVGISSPAGGMEDDGLLY